MALTFHIIYTPGTVHYLTFFVYSLLRWSDCSFRLVTNGCSPAEETYLRHFCQQAPRLDFYRLPTDQMLIHGEALNHLQERTQEAKFCFMDSDIYATGPFLPDFLPLAERYTALSACAPIWCKPEEQIAEPSHPILAGELSRTDTGTCLGVTFFAIYDNQQLTNFRKATQLGFARARWRTISPTYQRRLQHLKMRKEIYDTGKLLNLIWQDQGHTLAMVETGQLAHLGGVSDISRIQQDAARVGQLPPTPRWKILPLALYRHLRRVLRRRRPGYYDFGFANRRELYKLYWGEYLQALYEDKPLPPLPTTGEPAIETAMGAAMQQIRDLYQQSTINPQQFLRP